MFTGGTIWILKKPMAILTPRRDRVRSDVTDVFEFLIDVAIDVAIDVRFEVELLLASSRLKQQIAALRGRLGERGRSPGRFSSPKPDFQTCELSFVVFI